MSKSKDMTKKHYLTSDLHWIENVWLCLTRFMLQEFKEVCVLDLHALVWKLMIILNNLFRSYLMGAWI